MPLLLEAASPGRECRWPLMLHRVDVEAKTIGNGAWPDVDARQGIVGSWIKSICSRAWKGAARARAAKSAGEWRGRVGCRALGAGHLCPAVPLGYKIRIEDGEDRISIG